jgi:DeoR/GlpR family transcriptional regulator of sugar metabolism
MLEKQKGFSINEKKFIDKLISEGEVDVANFAAEIGKSRQSVYNYYHSMKNLIVFERSKGKIKLYWKEKRSADSFAERLLHNQKLKESIADFIVSKYINDYDQIFLDCGSTTIYIAEAFLEQSKSNLEVATTNPYVMHRLIGSDQISNLLVLGGIVNRKSGAFYGPWVSTLLKNINYTFKKTFLGVDGIRISRENRNAIQLTIGNSLELEQKKLIIEKSDKVYIVLDDTKIDGGGEKLMEISNDGEKTQIMINGNQQEHLQLKIIMGCQEEGRDKIQSIYKDTFADIIDFV